MYEVESFTIDSRIRGYHVYKDAQYVTWYMYIVTSMELWQVQTNYWAETKVYR